MPPPAKAASKTSGTVVVQAPQPTTALRELPDRPWDATQKHRLDNADDIAQYAPRGLFRNDYLAICKMLGLRPHPQLLPFEAAIPTPSSVDSAIKVAAWRAGSLRLPERTAEELQVAAKEEPRYFDFTVLPNITVRNMVIGRSDSLAAFEVALRTARHIETLELSGVNLDAVQLLALARVLPQTAVQRLTIDFNPLSDSMAVPPQPTISTGAGPHPGQPRPQSPTPAGMHAVGGNARAQAATAAAAQPAPTGSPPAPASSTSAEDAAPATHAFAALLRRSCPIKRLSLRGCALTSDDGLAIGAALAFNTTLQELVLSHNPSLGEAGVAALCVGVRENKSLLKLLLADVGMSSSR
jgi:hypothetical protein